MKSILPFGYYQKDCAVEKLARHIAFSQLGPSAAGEELEKRVEDLLKGHIKFLYQIFLAEPELQGTGRPEESLPEDFVDWYKNVLKDDFATD